MFSGRSCTKVRVQVQCASTVFSITWICLQRTLLLLVSPGCGRLQNAQRTISRGPRQLWSGGHLHVSAGRNRERLHASQPFERRHRNSPCITKVLKRYVCQCLPNAGINFPNEALGFTFPFKSAAFPSRSDSEDVVRLASERRQMAPVEENKMR